MQFRLIALLSLALAATSASAANVYIICRRGVNNAEDKALANALVAAGHRVTVGPIADKFNGQSLPKETEVVIFRQDFDYSNVLPDGGQAILVDFVSRGGGLIVSGDRMGQYFTDKNKYKTLRPILPFSDYGFNYYLNAYALTRESGNARINAGLGAVIGVPSDFDYGDKASFYVSKPEAVTFYTSIDSDSKKYSSVVGWNYNFGRVIALPFSDYVRHVKSADVCRLLSNAVDWAATSKMPRIVFQNTSNSSLSYWKLANNKVSGSPVAIAGSPDADSRLFGVADFNRDGIGDLGFRSNKTGAINQWFLFGNGVQGMAGITAPRKTTNTLVGFADFNKDGSPDPLYLNPTLNQFEVDIHNGFISGSTFVLNSSPMPGQNAVGVGDIDGDGKPDLIWQHKTTRKVGYWKLDGTTVGPFVEIAKTVPSGDAVVGTGDVDGDGKDDILFFNKTSRAITLWLAGGTTVLKLGTAPAGCEPRGGGNW